MTKIDKAIIIFVVVFVLSVMVYIWYAACPTEYSWSLQHGCEPTGGAPTIINNTNDNKLTMLVDIKGCVASDTKKDNTRGILSDAVRNKPLIKTIGDSSISYIEVIDHACCLDLKIEQNVIDDTINITKHWTGNPCRCMCVSEVKVQIDYIPAGNYRVNIYNDNDINDVDNEAVLIFSQELEVG